MTKIYSIPQVEVLPVTQLSMLCESSGPNRVSSNVDLRGGNASGDVTSAF